MDAPYPAPAATYKTIIHLVHADTDALMGATTVAGRIHEVGTTYALAVEVFIFAAAQRALTDPRKEPFNRAVDQLIAQGVPVTACTNFARKLGAAEQFAARGIRLEPARDAFIRYTMEGSTVITL